MGMAAIGLAYVVGFVVAGFHDPLALAAVFLVVIVATIAPGRIWQAVRSDPFLGVAAALLILMASALTVRFLISPTYITP